MAGADGAGPGVLARESAAALAGLGPDGMGMVTACRRLVDRHPSVGPLWWLASRVLAASEPGPEARQAAEALDADPTPDVLASCLPADATVVVPGWPEQVGRALRRRGDLRLLVLDCAGAGSSVARRLRAVGAEHVVVPDTGLALAVSRADLVVLEAWALGTTGFVATAGSRAAAAVARHDGVQVWVAAGVGRVLPPRLWAALERRVGEAPSGAPWEAPEEVVSLDLADHVVRPDGLRPAEEAAAGPDCALVPELLHRVR